MIGHCNRRSLLKHLAATSAAFTLPRGANALNMLLQEPADDREIQITSVSEHTVRLSVLPVRNNKAAAIPFDGSLVQTTWDEPMARLRGNSPPHELKAGALSIRFSASPITFTISTPKGTSAPLHR